MSSLERQLTELINGVETPISPMTDSSTIYYNSKKLSDILPSVNPITLTKAEYEAKVEAGEITDESEEVYYVIDDIDGFTISDSVVSDITTFSSKKIIELVSGLSSSDLEAGNGFQTSQMVHKFITLEPHKWNGYKRPYTYTIPLEQVTQNSLVTVNINNTLTDDYYNKQYEAIGYAAVKRIKQHNGNIVLYAYGEKPIIPIELIITVQN